MDIVDTVVYRWDDSADPEATRQAFCNVFDVGSAEARLVIKYLVGICKWEDEMDYNDPVMNAKWESLRGIIRSIKKQLNMKPIEEVDPEDQEIS